MTDYHPIEIWIDDAPDGWETWPLSERLEAVVADRYATDDVGSADRIELMVRRVGTDDEPMSLTASIRGVSGEHRLQAVVLADDLSLEHRRIGGLVLVCRVVDVYAIRSRITGD
jgi:hypothetical protein